MLNDTFSDAATSTHTPDRATFGVWLKTNRRAHDLTQYQLARRVGCAEITIRKIEADQLRPSERLVELLLQELGAPRKEQEMLMRLARKR